MRWRNSNLAFADDLELQEPTTRQAVINRLAITELEQEIATFQESVYQALTQGNRDELAAVDLWLADLRNLLLSSSSTSLMPASESAEKVDRCFGIPVSELQTLLDGDDASDDRAMTTLLFGSSFESWDPDAVDD